MLDLENINMDDRLLEMSTLLSEIEGIKVLGAYDATEENDVCRIWFSVSNIKDLNRLINCHLYCVTTWKIIVDLYECGGDSSEGLVLYLESSPSTHKDSAGNDLDAQISIMEDNFRIDDEQLEDYEQWEENY